MAVRVMTVLSTEAHIQKQTQSRIRYNALRAVLLVRIGIIPHLASPPLKSFLPDPGRAAHVHLRLAPALR